MSAHSASQSGGKCKIDKSSRCGRPVTSRTDSQTIRELRRLGGLLKHNFESVREAGGQQALPQMEDTLEAVRLAIERLCRE